MTKYICCACGYTTEDLYFWCPIEGCGEEMFKEDGSQVEGPEDE